MVPGSYLQNDVASSMVVTDIASDHVDQYHPTVILLELLSDASLTAPLLR